MLPTDAHDIACEGEPTKERGKVGNPNTPVKHYQHLSATGEVFLYIIDVDSATKSAYNFDVDTSTKDRKI